MRLVGNKCITITIDDLQMEGMGIKNMVEKRFMPVEERAIINTLPDPDVPDFEPLARHINSIALRVMDDA
jgi:hypothetical protein